MRPIHGAGGGCYPKTPRGTGPLGMSGVRVHSSSRSTTAGTGQHSRERDGAGGVPVGVVHQGVEGLVHPLPEYHGGHRPARQGGQSSEWVQEAAHGAWPPKKQGIWGVPGWGGRGEQTCAGAGCRRNKTPCTHPSWSLQDHPRGEESNQRWVQRWGPAQARSLNAPERCTEMGKQSRRAP